MSILICPQIICLANNFVCKMEKKANCQNAWLHFLCMYLLFQLYVNLKSLKYTTNLCHRLL